MSKDMRDWPRADLGVAANMFILVLNGYEMLSKLYIHIHPSCFLDFCKDETQNRICRVDGERRLKGAKAWRNGNVQEPVL